jgi:protein-S-isoprenylcysteine O-methyltransferase Ste14
MTLDLKLPPVLQLLVAAGLVGALDRLPPFAGLNFPGQTALAGLLYAAGAGLILAAAYTFRKADTTLTPLNPEQTSTLVVSGVFRYSRNPVYLGLAVILAGLAVHLGTPTGLAVPLVFAGTITRFQIIPEERALAENFGDAFERYKRTTRRWI